MFLESFIFGLFIGFIRKGRISRLEHVEFNAKAFIYISALLYLSIIIMNLGLFDYNSNLYTMFLIISYLFMVIFMVLNLEIKYMFLPLIGIILNLIVFCANKFKFPILSSTVADLHGSELFNLFTSNKVIFFIPAENANLSFLGTVISVGNMFTISIGDLFVSIGIILIIQEIICDKHIQNRKKISFSKKLFK